MVKLFPTKTCDTQSIIIEPYQILTYTVDVLKNIIMMKINSLSENILENITKYF
jgi:hypothetical protein